MRSKWKAHTLVIWLFVYLLLVLTRRNIFTIIIVWPITVGAFFGVHWIVLRTVYIILFIHSLLMFFFHFYFAVVSFELPLRASKSLSPCENIVCVFFLFVQELTGLVYVIYMCLETQHIMKITSEWTERIEKKERREKKSRNAYTQMPVQRI